MRDATLQEQGHGGVGAEGAVAQNDIAFFELRPEFAKEEAVVGGLPSGDMGQKRTGGQGKEAHHLENREAAARLLPFGLGPDGLVFGRIGHGDAGPVDDLHVASWQQLFVFQDSPFQGPGDLVLD